MVKAVDRNRIAVLLVLIRLNSGHPFEIFVYMYVSVCIFLVKWLVSHSMLQGFGAESRSKVEKSMSTRLCLLQSSVKTLNYLGMYFSALYKCS